VIRLALVLTVLLAPAAQASRLVDYSRTGGIAGEHTTLKVDRDRHLTLASRQGDSERRMSKKRYIRVRDALRAAQFETLESSYGPPPNQTVSDGITETVTFRGHTVSVSTGGDPPERLQTVLDKLSALTTPQ
jgi:hypothetical protein